MACRTFGVSETWYRYCPLLSYENEQIADLLVGLTDAQKTWAFGLCFLHRATSMVSTSGQPVLISSLFGIAKNAALVSDPLVLAVNLI